MNVVIFSGTTEGRSFSRALAALGAAVTVCVATELGAEEQGCADGITVRTGRLDAEGMTALLRGAALCVDATHPYAAEATRNIRAAAAAARCRALDDAGLPYTVLPGVSSVQLLAAALGRPWQGWRLVSAHGCACDPVAACRAGGTTFFLTGGSETPATLCQQLADAGLGDAAATVGENLGTPSQRLVTGRAQELAAQHFAPLSVLLVENVPAPLRRTPGLPDAAFIRGKTPMTKQEVRAAALAKLAVRPTDTLWDVGAGTGSVSVELALAAPAGRVCAVECDAEACDLIRQNRAKFAVQNLQLTEGLAPAALAGWPAPDAVFIGGSKGTLRAVVDAALAANPDARLCISAIALETLQEAVAALTAHGLTAQVTQIAVSRSRAAGNLHLLMANNPVFLIARE